MKIQILSDLHIEHFRSLDDFNSCYHKEFGTNLCEKVYGEILVLAGDIGNPFKDGMKDFLKYCSKNYKHVMIVAGNHGRLIMKILVTDSTILERILRK